MPLFATYRNARLMPKNFLDGWVKWHRGIGEWYGQRPWANGAFWLPGFSNLTVFLGWLVPWYFIQKQYMARQWNLDEYERTLILRWGGDKGLEGVRHTLSPADQARARGYYFYERVHGVFLPNKMKFAPAGSDLATASHGGKH